MTRRPIDLERVRLARAALDAAVKRWPHLVGPEARRRLAEWMKTGGPDRAPDGEEQGIEMAPMEITLQVRVAGDFVARLDRLAEAMRDTPAAHAAGRFNRSMAARLSMIEGLAVLEARHGVTGPPEPAAPEPPPGKPRRRGRKGKAS